ncbi:hypothetical protein Dda_5796 [Drechslerella dactyloides]|uniref:Uncharacterized protein n=1 Tax=Drechslerella dactyloides TaxID=74499 RepID=A0AAD6IYJ4_DREDA|nr:hypothetical protein Dda_5796 [Drechslerella dactyloides]
MTISDLASKRRYNRSGRTEMPQMKSQIGRRHESRGTTVSEDAMLEDIDPKNGSLYETPLLGGPGSSFCATRATQRRRHSREESSSDNATRFRL